MAIIKAISSRASIARAINYITKQEKTERKLIGGYNCNPVYAIEEMQGTKEEWRKTGGRQYKHFIQSFPKDEQISYEEAFQIAKELIERCPFFRGYEVCYATHMDRNHVHTHIVVNSVSFEDGYKFRYSKRQLQELKDLSDEILLEHGKNICEKNREITSFQMGAYRSIEKAAAGTYKSWMLDTMKAINAAMKIARGKDEFIALLAQAQYDVNWSDNRKYIVFITPDGKKVRDKTLAKTFKVRLSKEDLLNEFKGNYGRSTGRTEPDQGRATSNVTGSGNRGNRGNRKRGAQESAEAIRRRLQSIDRIHEEYSINGDGRNAEREPDAEPERDGGNIQTPNEQPNIGTRNGRKTCRTRSRDDFSL